MIGSLIVLGFSAVEVLQRQSVRAIWLQTQQESTSQRLTILELKSSTINSRQIETCAEMTLKNKNYLLT